MPQQDQYNAVLDTISQDVKGFIGASVVDLDTGMTMAVRAARPGFDLETASAYNSEMVKAKLKTMQVLGLNTQLEDMLLTLGDQLHLIKMMGTHSFVYVAADRGETNLALLRNSVNRAIS